MLICYVYARIKDNDRVLVIHNGSDKDADLDMSRYSDVTADCTSGRDIISGATFSLVSTMHVPARGTFILELK